MEKIKISKLKLNPKNPRFIRDEKFEKLKKSITEFPQMMDLRPIVVDDDMIILGGNMRYRACLDLGWQEVPFIKAKELTEEQKQEFIIKDNVPFGEWDWDLIANEWDQEKLQEWGLDMPLLQSQEAQEDDFEIPDKIETEIKTGDLIEIGAHRLICGDSRDKEVFEKLLQDQRVDMVFTDPPYGVSIGAKNRMLNSFQPSGRNLKDIEDDAKKPEDLKKILLPAFRNIREAMDDSCTVFVTAPQGGDLGMMMMMMMKESGLGVRHVLIWKKNSPTFSMGRLDYDYQHEPILLTWGKKHNYYGLGQHKTSVWEIDKPRSNKEHPTMKPIELIANALLNNSKIGDKVLDAYMGSGSTMVACHQLNRICYGIEIDPEYCQVTIDRMLALDPSLEVKINGQPFKKSTENALTNG